MSPNSRKNLELGRRPNTRRAKDSAITPLVREMLDEVADERWIHPSDYGKTWRQCIAKALLVGAVKGNPTLVKELLDRLEGRPKESVEISGKDGQPIQITGFQIRVCNADNAS